LFLNVSDILPKFIDIVDLGSCLFTAYSTPPILVFISVPNISCSAIPISGFTSKASFFPSIASVIPTSPPDDAAIILQYLSLSSVNSVISQLLAGNCAVIAADLAPDSPVAAESTSKTTLSSSTAFEYKAKKSAALHYLNQIV